MRRDIRDAWADALESGEYRQGKQTLHQRKYNGRDDEGNETYEHYWCCLGVLCDLAVKADVLRALEPRETWNTTYNYDGTISVLPRSVMEWAGLVNSTVNLVDGISAVYANDTLGWNFRKIAEHVRALPADDDDENGEEN